MTTNTMTASTTDWHLNNDGWNKVAQAVARLGQNTAGLFARTGKSIWTVSLELQPFQRSFSQPHGVAGRQSERVWPTEQASINSILMG